jgi:hypothetical protein
VVLQAALLVVLGLQQLLLQLVVSKLRLVGRQATHSGALATQHNAG